MQGSNYIFSENKFRPMLIIVLRSGLIAGTLDGLAAIIAYGPVFGRATVSQIFQGIASALFGRSAFAGGWRFTFYGILLHYTIALLFSTAYGIAYTRFAFLQKRWWANGVLYGLIVWVIMNKLVLPLAGMHSTVTSSSMILGMMILILCVGTPIALFTHLGLRSHITRH
jgi:hypothetical protein